MSVVSSCCMSCVCLGVSCTVVYCLVTLKASLGRRLSAEIDFICHMSVSTCHPHVVHVPVPDRWPHAARCREMWMHASVLGTTRIDLVYRSNSNLAFCTGSHEPRTQHVINMPLATVKLCCHVSTAIHSKTHAEKQLLWTLESVLARSARLHPGECQRMPECAPSSCSTHPPATAKHSNCQSRTSRHCAFG